MEPHSEDQGRLGGLFEQYSHTPGPDVWDRIAAEPTDRPLGSKFWAFTWAPDGRVWRRIAGELHPVPYRRIAAWAAAASVGLLALIWGAGAGNGNEPAQGMALRGHAQEWPAATEAGCLPDGPAWVPDLRQQGAMAQLTGHPTPRRNGVSGQGKQDAPRQSLAGGAGITQPFPVTGPDGMSPRHQGLARPLHDIDHKADFTHLLAYTEAVERNRLLEQQAAAAGERPRDWAAEPIYAMASTNLSMNQAAPLQNDGGTYDPGPLTTGTPSFDGLAQNENSGPEVPDEDFAMPVVLGFGLERKVWGNLSAGVGLAYTRLQSSRDYVTASVDQHQDILRQYLGVSTSAYYSHGIGRSKARAYATAGLQYDFGLGYRSELVSKVDGVETSRTTGESRLPGQASVNAGLGLSYNVWKAVSLYAQGSASHYFYQGAGNVFTSKVVWPTAQVGVRLAI